MGSEIRTTVNIRSDNYLILSDYSKRFGLGCKEVIIFLLRKIVLHIAENEEIRDRALEYQPDAKEWRKEHVTFKNDDFSRIMDVKNCYRFSCSLMLAMALDMFDESIFIEETEDSYPEFLSQKRLERSDAGFFFTSYWKYKIEIRNLNKGPG